MKEISIKKNYIYSTLYEVLSIITPLITAPYTSRIFGAEGVGIQSYTNSIVSYFTLFAALGVESYGQREIARHRDNPEASSKIFWEILFLTLGTTSICLVGWLILIFCSGQYTAYYAVLTITLVAVPFDISWFFGGYEQFRYIVLRNTFFRLAGIAVLFIFVRKPSDLLLYMALLAATGLVGNLSMWSYLPQFLVKIDFRTLNVRRHIKETFIYFVPTIATSVYTVLDKTMIGVLTGNEAENGYYEQATKVINIAKSMIFSLNTVMSARMSYLFAQEKMGEMKEKLDQSFGCLMLLGIPMTLGIIGVSANFVPWFFGDGYERTIILLCILSPLIVIISISNCLGAQYFIPTGQRIRSTKGILCGSAINFVCNLCMIPAWGAAGAAVASVLAEMAISAIYVHMSREFSGWGMIWKNSWKKLIAGLLMLFTVFAIGWGHTGDVWITVLQVLVGAGVYFFSIILLKDKQVLEILNSGRVSAVIEKLKGIIRK